jgi:hypothetical protein
LAFIHVQRTGGTTVKWMLRSSFGMRHCDVESWRSVDTPVSASDLIRLHRFYPVLKSIAGHQVVPHSDLTAICPRIQYFIFLRDPVKRLASYHQLNVQIRPRTHILEDWLRQDDIRDGQTRQITGTVDVDSAIRMIHDKGIFVGLTECFDESLLLLKSLLVNDLNIAYVRKNVASDNSLAKRTLADDRTRQMIVDATRADRELYDYVKRELYPSYRREYGSSLDQDLARLRQNRHGYNSRNVVLNRLQRNLVYKPALHLYRLWGTMT